MLRQKAKECTTSSTQIEKTEWRVNTVRNEKKNRTKDEKIKDNEKKNNTQNKILQIGV